MDPALLLFAFSAGAVGFFAPCCIAMLPAYVGYAVRGPGAAETGRSSPWGQRLFVGGMFPTTLGAVPLLALGLGSFVSLPYELTSWLPGVESSLALLVLGLAASVAGVALLGRTKAAARGALFGALATLGFLTVFLAIGLPIAFLARWLAPYLAWLAVVVGVVLVALGVLTLAGKSITVPVPGLRGDVSSPRGFYLFGLGYGVASLSCTFPVFLAVIAAGAVSGGFLSALGMFGAYAMGKATLLVGVTVLTIAGGAQAGARVKRLTHAMKTVSGVILIVAGAYIAYYFVRFAPGI